MKTLKLFLLFPFATGLLAQEDVSLPAYFNRIQDTVTAQEKLHGGPLSVTVMILKEGSGAGSHPEMWVWMRYGEGTWTNVDILPLGPKTRFANDPKIHLHKQMTHEGVYTITDFHAGQIGYESNTPTRPADYLSRWFWVSMRLTSGKDTMRFGGLYINGFDELCTDKATGESIPCAVIERVDDGSIDVLDNSIYYVYAWARAAKNATAYVFPMHMPDSPNEDEESFRRYRAAYSAAPPETQSRWDELQKVYLTLPGYKRDNTYYVEKRADTTLYNDEW